MATNYHRKMAMLMSVNQEDVSNGAWRVEQDSRAAIQMYSSPYGSAYSNANVVIPAWMTDKVIQDCMIDVNGYLANILEDFGQAKQTVESILDLATLIGSTTLLMLKGKFRQAFSKLGLKDPIKATSNVWLAYFYGISPLISTIQALAKAHGPKKDVYTANRKLDIPVDPLGFVAPTYSWQCVVLGGTATMGVKCQMTVSRNVSSNIAELTSMGVSGNDSIDLAVTAWALVPYSFVVDWLLPIERYLRTRQWSTGLDYQSGYVSKRLHCDAVVRRPYNSYTGYFPKGNLATVWIRSLQIQRLAYNYIVPPSSVHLTFDLTPTSIASLSALIVQMKR